MEAKELVADILSCKQAYDLGITRGMKTYFVYGTYADMGALYRAEQLMDDTIEGEDFFPAPTTDEWLGILPVTIEEKGRLYWLLAVRDMAQYQRYNDRFDVLKGMSSISTVQSLCDLAIWLAENGIWKPEEVK
ncbi:MAG: hypothetical protein WC683_04395 [bacterium]